MAIKIPDKVKIGAVRFKVERHKRVMANDGTRLCGEINHMTAVIRLDASMSDDRAFVTLMHEVLHGCDDLAGTDLSEDVIDRIAPYVAAFMVDNGYAKGEE